MERKNNVTFSDIAKYTHFSKTTISRYFNNPDSLTLKNQKIISDALEKLNYKENKVAKILANGKTEFIGIIIPNLYLHYYSELLNQLLLSYNEFGYKFLVFISDNNEKTEQQYIQELMAYKVEGLIVLSHTIPSQELANLHLPIVAIEREDHFISSINTDNYMGAIQAVSLLVKHGCEILIHINTPTDKNIPAYGRMKGFRDFCEEHQVENEMFIEPLSNNYEESRKQLGALLEIIDKKYSGKKKGIFITNDTHANTFLNLLIRKYGGLPKDYYLVGFDGAPISAQAIIPITTVAQQIDKIAHEAMLFLVEQMNERKKRKPNPLPLPVHKIITPILIHRETTEKDL